MSEVEKLYESAGVEKDLYCCDGSCGEPTKRCKDCPDYREIYPLFTAEKQLNLIIFLANREIRISPTYISSGYYLNNIKKIKSSRNISTFETSLAQHINAIWQDLTEEEKQQVKGILE
jgi:hypothetical protein